MFETLLVSFICIAFIAVLDDAKQRRLLKSSDQELSSAREEITSLNDDHNKEISDLNSSFSIEREDFQNEIAKLNKIIEHKKAPVKLPPPIRPMGIK